MIKPSKYQQAFWNAVMTHTGNIVLQASAGSAKTYSLVEACKYLPYGKIALYAAFNRHIVTELKERLPKDIQCYTLHALGLSAIRKHYPPDSVKVSDGKQIRFIEPLFEKEKTRREKWTKILETDQILRLVRATMTELNEESLTKMLEAYAIYPDQDIINAVVISGNDLYEYNSNPHRYGMEVDFQDMIELCVRDKEIRMPQYDYVMLDEAQDCSKLDQLFIERIIKVGRGRLIVAGDPRQSCYAFRGADVKSFEYFENRPNTIKLPLTISYRCGKKIVEHAKKIWSEIEPWEENADGEVKVGTLDEVSNNSMVIARNLRPLVEAFFQLVEKGKKCTIVGKELEKGLLAILDGVHGDMQTGEALNDTLQAKLDRKKQELIKLGYSSPMNHPKYVNLEEKVKVIKRIASKCGTVEETERLIGSIFSDRSIAPIKLMTIHKSKGLEADNVFVIERFEGNKLIPNQYAVTKEQLIQERNLEFVACTRAKKLLVKVML